MKIMAKKKPQIKSKTKKFSILTTKIKIKEIKAELNKKIMKRSAFETPVEYDKSQKEIDSLDLKLYKMKLELKRINRIIKLEKGSILKR